MANDKRRGHITRSQVQRSILLRYLCHWSLFVCCVFAISAAFHLVFRAQGETFSTFLIQQWNQYSLALIVLFALVPYFFLDLTKLSHRFTGPMIRFEDALKRAASGEPVEPIQFRDGDFWGEMAENFNSVMKQIPAIDTPDHNVADLAVESENALESSKELVAAE